MEVAAGKVKSKPVMLGNGMADVVQWTFASAAANNLNVLRSFAHGVDGSFPLQIKAGQFAQAVTRLMSLQGTFDAAPLNLRFAAIPHVHAGLCSHTCLERCVT